MNYQALGEYTAYQKQATDAAMRRFVLLHNIAGALKRSADMPEENLNIKELQERLLEAESLDREMLAAVARANQASALCGEAEIRPASFRRD